FVIGNNSNTDCFIKFQENITVLHIVCHQAYWQRLITQVGAHLTVQPDCGRLKKIGIWTRRKHYIFL
ncbi:MAG: hypothetical protein NC131_12980, partial [Roseburia sp.]|nr:hypothetical protein [Roseburia sp.]